MAIESKDLIISTFRPKAGVWSNNAETSVRITHLPTGISIEEGKHRSAHKNKAIALERLEKLVASLDKPEQPVSVTMTDDMLNARAVDAGAYDADSCAVAMRAMRELEVELLSRAPDAQAVRNAALEEAAKIPWQVSGNTNWRKECSDAIKMMQSAPVQPVERMVGVEEGKALVPLIPNQAMRDVMDEEGWQWEDLLAAADAITEEQYSAIAANQPQQVRGTTEERFGEDLMAILIRHTNLSQDAIDERVAMFIELSKPEAQVRGKAQEPDEYQFRMRPTWLAEGEGWTEWAKCSEGSYRDYIRMPNLHGWQYEVRTLYAAAPQVAQEKL